MTLLKLYILYTKYTFLQFSSLQLCVFRRYSPADMMFCVCLSRNKVKGTLNADLITRPTWSLVFLSLLKQCVFLFRANNSVFVHINSSSVSTYLTIRSVLQLAQAEVQPILLLVLVSLDLICRLLVNVQSCRVSTVSAVSTELCYITKIPYPSVTGCENTGGVDLSNPVVNASYFQHHLWILNFVFFSLNKNATSVGPTERKTPPSRKKECHCTSSEQVVVSKAADCSYQCILKLGLRYTKQSQTCKTNQIFNCKFKPFQEKAS